MLWRCRKKHYEEKRKAHRDKKKWALDSSPTLNFGN